jgi:hypothetical protein
MELADPVSLLPARGTVGERREDGADEMVNVVTSVMAMVALLTVPSASAVSGPRRDQDGQGQGGENEEELSDHTALRRPEAAFRL